MLNYNKMQQLVKFSVEYYEKFSVIELSTDNENFIYFPHYNKVVNMNGYSTDSSLLNNLEELDSDKSYYLVNEPLIRFTIINNLSINDEDNLEDFDSNMIYDIYEDVKNNDKLFNFNYKKSQFYITTVIDYNWTQGYDDSDCELIYLGIIENITFDSLIKSSKNRIIKLKKIEKEMCDEFYNNLQRDPDFLF